MKIYKSNALAAVHELAPELHGVGALPKKTMRQFDELCLTPVHKLAPDEIKAIR